MSNHKIMNKIVRNELSVLELRVLIKEFQALIGTRVANIHQLGLNDVLFTFRRPGGEKSWLRFALPKWVWLTQYDAEKQDPGRFVSFARKKLDNTILTALEQLGSDRILQLTFSVKNTPKFILIAELFSHGNLILCNEEKKIISASEERGWKGREIKRGESYKLPPSPTRRPPVSKKAPPANLSAELDAVLPMQLKKKAVEQAQTTATREIEALRKSLAVQEKAVKKHETAAADAKAKGEAIYARFGELKPLVERALYLHKRYGWKKAIPMLKKEFPQVKELKEKEWKLVLELE